MRIRPVGNGMIRFQERPDGPVNAMRIKPIWFRIAGSLITPSPTGRIGLDSGPRQ